MDVPAESLLKDKVVLVVDDEPDVLETVEEELDMCLVHKAGDYETAYQYLVSYTYDIVILDIMGVNGFELLKVSVSHGFPTVMLTAHALSTRIPEDIHQTGRRLFSSQGKDLYDSHLPGGCGPGAGKTGVEKAFRPARRLFQQAVRPRLEGKGRVFPGIRGRTESGSDVVRSASRVALVTHSMDVGQALRDQVVGTERRGKGRDTGPCPTGTGNGFRAADRPRPPERVRPRSGPVIPPGTAFPDGSCR